MRWIMATQTLVVLVGGCSHYRSSMKLDASVNAHVVNDLAVGGILDRSAGGESQPTIASEPTKLLIEMAQGVDRSTSMGPKTLGFLLQSPLELSMNAETLRKVQGVLGHRYVLLGAQGSSPVRHVVYWRPIIIIPAPYVIISFAFDVKVSQKANVAHASRLVRVVDLENATILAESLEVLRDDAAGSGFTRRQVLDALQAVNVAKE